MGSAGSVELTAQPSQIVCTPAKQNGDNNAELGHSNNRTTNTSGNFTSSPSRNLGLSNGSTPTRRNEDGSFPSSSSTQHIEYIGVWEYKLSTENTDDESTWIPFSPDDQSRLDAAFKTMRSEIVMAMVGRTAWNVHIAGQFSSPADRVGFAQRSVVSFKMTRGSGHGGIARRRRIEKPDVHAPSPFDVSEQGGGGDDGVSGNNSSENLGGGGGRGTGSMIHHHNDREKNLNELQDVSEESNQFSVNLHSTIKAHQSLVYCIDFSRDGNKVLSGSRDGTFRYWELGSSQALCDYVRITDGVILSCAISPNGKLAVCGSSNAYAYLWSTERKPERAIGEHGQFQRALTAFHGHTHKVYGAKFTSDSRTLVTGAMDHTVRTWDVVKELPIRKITPHSAAVFTIAASRHNPNLILSGADDHLLVSHDLRTPSDKGTGVFKGHTATIWASDIRFDDQQFVSGGMDGACLLWDARNPSKPLMHVGDHGIYPVHCAEFLPEGNHVLTSARDSTWRLWDIKNNTSIAESSGGGDEGETKTAATTSHSQYNPMVSSPCCKDVCKVTAHKGNVFKIAYEPLRNLVMTCGSDGLIKVFKLNQRF